MFYYFGIGINFFLLLVLLLKKEKSTADIILAVWLLLIGLHTLLFVVNLQPATLSTIHWILAAATPFPLLHGPFLYLYTAASTNMLPVKKTVWLLHFMPAIIIIIALLPLYTMTAGEKMELYLSGGRQYQAANVLLLLLIQVSGIAYVFSSFWLLRKHKQNIGNQFSYEEKINLNWLRYLIYSLFLIWLIIIFVKKNVFIFGAGVLFVTLLGLLGIRQVGIFGSGVAKAAEPSRRLPAAGEEEWLLASNAKTKKYANSGLTSEKAAEIHKKLGELMASEKWFTEPDLTLLALASRLKVHPNHLSQVINEREGRSFFDYINFLRITECKRLMTLPSTRQFTIIALAYECGYNSKSAFNKNFRKLTGQSPSAYLKTIDSGG